MSEIVYIIHKTTREGYLVKCGKKVGNIKKGRWGRVMTKPHTHEKIEDIKDDEMKVLCDGCWNTYNLFCKFSMDKICVWDK